MQGFDWTPIPKCAASVARLLWMERMMAAAGVDVSAAQDNDAWLLPIPATLIVGRDGVIPRMGIEDMLAALRALIAVLVQAIVRLPESAPTGASMRGVWPPRSTLLPSNSVRWSMGAGLSQSCSFMTPERP
jgi:hypothetical protein